VRRKEGETKSNAKRKQTKTKSVWQNLAGGGQGAVRGRSLKSPEQSKEKEKERKTGRRGKENPHSIQKNAA